VLAASIGLGALVTVLLGLSSPLRAVVVFAFVLFVPGISLVRLLGFDDLAVNIALGCGLGISLAGTVAAALIYAGGWSPTLGLGFLLLVTIGAVTVELWRAEAAGRAGDSPAAARRRMVSPVRGLAASAQPRSWERET
jgi:hypothetical protein